MIKPASSVNQTGSNCQLPRGRLPAHNLLLWVMPDKPLHAVAPSQQHISFSLDSAHCSGELKWIPAAHHRTYWKMMAARYSTPMRM
jgi:hypothetical protein